MEINVGSLRQQVALSDANRRVVLVSNDSAVQSILSKLEIVEFYPDTTDENGRFGTGGAFKIALRRKP